MHTNRPRMLLLSLWVAMGLLLPASFVAAQAPSPAPAAASSAQAADTGAKAAGPREGTRAPAPADDLEPAVSTSDSAARAPAPAAPLAVGSAPTPGGGTPAARPASDSAAAARSTKPGGKAMDRLELDTTQITGNRELPKVLYIVPWKRSDLGDLVGKPANSLLDEVLQPVDRDVFKRENRYYRAVMPKDGATSGAAAGPGSRTGGGNP